MKYCVIVAYDTSRGINKDGSLSWGMLSHDLAKFAILTSSKKNAVIMGRKTWNSLPHHPLPNRLNIILSNSIISANGAIVVRSMDEIDDALATHGIQRAFFIGGESVYEQALKHVSIDEYYITEVFKRYECDTFFPFVNLSGFQFIWSNIHVENEVPYRITKYVRNNIGNAHTDEYQYLELMRHVLERGEYIDDRTGVGILAKFGDTKLHFDLRKTFPLLTTKRVFWKTMARELLFFLSGETNNKTLQSQGVHIWDGNSSREYLDQIGHPEWEEGELGKFYGFQWRHWGAPYPPQEGNNGCDQIAELIHGIKHNPSSRRHILTAWSPTDVKDVCLPPCHVLYQFHVHQNAKELSCTMYQRSADLFLGVPFNIASTALLTHLIAKTCDLTPRDMTVYYGNAHIYLSHVAQVKEQLSRNPFSPPTLSISMKRDRLEDYTIDDIIVHNYTHHPPIEAKMVV